MNITDQILALLPYSAPFRFVDEITDVTENGCEGAFRFHRSLPFYEGHFKEYPVTPGVLLTECCAQIGLVCLGLYLMLKEGQMRPEQIAVAMTSSEMEFMRPVFPDERVRVRSEKVYFRFSKLKCRVSMYNDENKLVCKGVIAGMLKPGTDE